MHACCDDNSRLRSCLLWSVGQRAADAVNTAKANNLRDAHPDDWYIDAKGLACVSHTLASEFSQGIMSVVYPEVFDKDSYECKFLVGNTASAQEASAMAAGSTAPRVIKAAPIPGRMNVETPCKDFGNCGPF